jgi:hypothetical protein
VTNDQPDLDKVVSALRSEATPAELAGEGTAVDAMASIMASAPATVRAFGSPRSLRVVAVVAASLIGMGGIAAAGAATFRPSTDRGDLRSADTVVADIVAHDTVDEATTTTTTTTIPGPTTVLDVTDDAGDVGVAPLVDDPATEFDETQCAEGNHGATVSSIAKETPPGPGHGDEVSIAAHSSCGKNATDDDATDDGTTTTVAATDDDSPGNSDGHGNSNGHGSGTGNSGGNGNGRGNGKPGG